MSASKDIFQAMDRTLASPEELAEMLDGAAITEAPEDQDPHQPLPMPDPAMLYGLAGEAGQAAAQGTEASPYAACMSFLVWLSGEVGRDVYLPIGNVWHHPRLFALHLGRSARGGKGEALALTKRIRAAIAELDPLLLGQWHTGGLSTREGLALMIHDGGFKIGKDEVPAISDKRLWIVESEFANVLHQGKRDGNTLSAALRDAWDGESIRPATKSARIWATEPHISLYGNITPPELRELMANREMTNGFANRFVIFWAERPRRVAFPQATPKERIAELASKTAAVIRFAKGKYPETRDSRKASLTPSAAKFYESLVYGELAQREPTERVAALMERDRPVLLRLALLFALTDQALLVEEKHLSAALAWVRYWRQSVRFLFASSSDAEDAEKTQETATRILSYLKSHGESSRTKLIQDCFQRHVQKEDLDRALDHLLQATPPAILLRDVPRKDGQPGRKGKVYFLNKAGEVSEVSEVRAMARADQSTHAGEVSEVSFTEAGNPDLSSQSSHGCEVSESKAGGQTSQSSQTSHPDQNGTDLEIIEQ